MRSQPPVRSAAIHTSQRRHRLQPREPPTTAPAVSDHLHVRSAPIGVYPRVRGERHQRAIAGSQVPQIIAPGHPECYNKNKQGSKVTIGIEHAMFWIV
jgi:hypothetical protein